MSPRAPAPWPPPPYVTGDPVIVPERDADRVASAPDPPPADTDPGHMIARAGITFKEATGAMKNFAGAMQRVGETIGAAFGGVVDSGRAAVESAREFEDQMDALPRPNESDRVYTEAEVSEIDAGTEAAGMPRRRYWWRKVGDRYRMVRGAGDGLRDENGNPFRLVDEIIHTPIGVAVTSGGPGEFVTVQVGGLDENGVPLERLDWERPIREALGNRTMTVSLAITIRGQLAAATTEDERREIIRRNGMIPPSAETRLPPADRPPAWRENVLLGPRAGHARPTLQKRLRQARKAGATATVVLFEQLTREGYDPLSENNVTDEALGSSTLMEALYELEFRRWRRSYNRVTYPPPHVPPLGPDQRPHPGPVVRAARQDEMQDAIVAALRGVARTPSPHPGLRRSPPVGDYNPNTDEIGNGVTHEELQNATTQAQRYDVLWRAGLIRGPYDNAGLSKRREQITSQPVVPTDPRKRRLRVRT